jgi:hypothetical protein
MAEVSVASGGSGNTGSLAEDRIFYVAVGSISFSTDGGTTFVPFGIGEKVVFSSGLTVHYENLRGSTSKFRHMPI